MAWDNADGLHVKFGTEQATVTKAGEYKSFGPLVVVEIEMAYTDFAANGTEKIMGDSSVIPNGATLEKAEFYVEDAFTSGGSATLSFGLIDQDRTTAIDADGIDQNIAVAALTDGATIDCDGALIHDTLTNAGLVTATVGTADFTAGLGRLRIYYYM